jgi:hypothetical protein
MTDQQFQAIVQEVLAIRRQQEELLQTLRGLTPVASRGIFKPTADLNNWSIANGRLFGQVRGHHAFTDGAWVTTSKVIEWSQDYRLCETENTIYILGTAAVRQESEEKETEK